MNAKQARSIASFLREALKQDTEAITIVMSRDIIKSMYDAARVAVCITEMIQGEEE